MHIKAKKLHFFYAKKLNIVQNQEKSIWCILKDILQVLLDIPAWYKAMYLLE